MTSGPRARLQRLPPLVWVLTVAVVVTGLVAALGGFAPARDVGRPAVAGEQILTSRWRIQVDRAALVDVGAGDPEPRIRVWLRTEFDGDDTLCCLLEGMFEVRYAGQALTRIWSSEEDPRSLLGFDPQVRVSRVLDFPLDGPVPDTVPDEVEVVIRDERPPRSLILTDWELGSAVAGVVLACPDERVAR
jgi:hypothetical protein